MAKEIKTYKRSEHRPIVMTEDQKKTQHAYEVTSGIIRYTIIAIVLLGLLFGMLGLFKIDVKVDELKPFNLDRFANISSYDLIGGWFATAEFDYPERNIYKGELYPRVFDFIVGEVPALKQAVGVAGDKVFGAISAKQENMLDMAYITMLIIEIVTLIWLLAMAIIFTLSFFKKFAPSQTMLNTSVLIHGALTFLMFVMTLALSSNSRAEFAFVVGVGMWLNLLVSVIAVTFVIFNMVFNAKIKANTIEIK